MITFNTLLQSEGVDPSSVKLVRHQAVGFALTPYQLWLNNSESFGVFQRFQARPVFASAAVLGSFVATPLEETVFVGLYSVRGVFRHGIRTPLSG